MRRLNILYLGSGAGTSRHRALALERLGHGVTVIDPRGLLPASRVIDRWIHHTGGVLLDQLISKRLPRGLGHATFDLLWIDGGALLTAMLVRELRSRCRFAINLNVDDPFGGRDGRKWRNYLGALDANDLVIVVRKENVDEALRSGARNAMFVYRSADEVAHAPRQLTPEDHLRWDSKVLFVGTWMPERGPFLARLVQLGVPLSIFGDRWHKAKEWRELCARWRGPGIYNDDEYAKAVQCAGVCLGLLSKGNRDLSTTRSFEIPYLGGVLCAERTVEHLELYSEGVDAVFWSTPEECAAKCGQLLRDEEWRSALSRNGRARCVRNRTLNESVLDEILSSVASSRSAAEVMV
jgi:spore maturation protein CgeB